jgi:hypothetical protein
MTSPVPAPEARELTPKEQEAEARVCFQLHNSVVAALKEGRASLWKLAEALHEFDEHAGWIRLGYDTKSEWLADPEVSMTQRTFRRLVRAWRVLHLRFGVDRPTLATLEVSKVDIVLPAIEKGSHSLREALDDVQTLGARDLRETYFGREEPPPAASDNGDGADGGNPVGAVPDGSGPVRASDGAPVDAIFDKEGDDTIVDADVVEEHELDPEDPLPAQDDRTWVRCGHCGAIQPVDEMEKSEPPPTE